MRSLAMSFEVDCGSQAKFSVERNVVGRPVRQLICIHEWRCVEDLRKKRVALITRTSDESACQRGDL